MSVVVSFSDNGLHASDIGFVAALLTEGDTQLVGISDEGEEGQFCFIVKGERSYLRRAKVWYDTDRFHVHNAKQFAKNIKLLKAKIKNNGNS